MSDGGGDHRSGGHVDRGTVVRRDAGRGVPDHLWELECRRRRNLVRRHHVEGRLRDGAGKGGLDRRAEVGPSCRTDGESRAECDRQQADADQQIS
jgi:hypothetical protein